MKTGLNHNLRVISTILLFFVLNLFVLEPVVQAQQLINMGRTNSFDTGKKTNSRNFGVGNRVDEGGAFPANDSLSMSAASTAGLVGGSSFMYTVHILGEVLNPGTYKVMPSDRVSDLIKYAGEILPNGSQRKLQLRRQGNSRPLDIYSYKFNGELDQNPYLVENDVIFVPLKKGEIQIEGPVNRPGYYEVEGGLNLDQVVKMSGGFTTGFTSKEPIRVIRFSDEGEKNIIEVSNYGKNSKQLRIQKGDIVIVPHVLLEGHTFDYNVSRIPGDNIFFPTINSNVNVIGAVTAPGAYPFQPSFNYLDYVGVAGPTDKSSLKRVKIITADGKRTRITKAKTINPGDTIFVPNKAVTLTNALTWFNTIAGTTLTTLLLYDRLSTR